MTGGYARSSRLDDLLACPRELAVETIIIDVEPLVAPRHGGQEPLDRGVARVLGQVRQIPSVRVVVFATNSARRPSAVPPGDGVQVRYLASAAKPLRTAPYRDLPRPGAVIGDQLPTDGLLAYRLGYTFLHYAPHLTGVPGGPRLVHRWGQLIRPVLFRRPACPPDDHSPRSAGAYVSIGAGSGADADAPGTFASGRRSCVRQRDVGRPQDRESDGRAGRRDRAGERSPACGFAAGHRRGHPGQGELERRGYFRSAARWIEPRPGHTVFSHCAARRSPSPRGEDPDGYCGTTAGDAAPRSRAIGR